MTMDIYVKLREQLDQYSTGFPLTQSGVEMKILEKLFSENDASMYLSLSMLLETPESVAERIGQDPESTAVQLERMAKKGLIFRHKKDGITKYSAIPFVIGSYEFQLKHMDLELAELVEAYMEEAMHSNLNNSLLPLRTIPVNKSIDVIHNVAAYEDAKQIVNGKEKIAVAECICRKQQRLLNKGCDKPLETCMVFGSHADYYVENGMARFITKEEACKILDMCEEAGLVNQPANMLNPGGMCNCCGDCCGVLRGLKKLPNPGELVSNKYWAVVDEEECTACETCIGRCQMDAITIGDNDAAIVDTARCIGCGLCVTTCPMDAINFVEKPETLQIKVPSSGQELMALTAEKRGTSLIPLQMLQDQ